MVVQQQTNPAFEELRVAEVAVPSAGATILEDGDTSEMVLLKAAVAKEKKKDKGKFLTLVIPQLIFFKTPASSIIFSFFFFVKVLS